MSSAASLPIVLAAALAGTGAGWLHFYSLRLLADRIVAGAPRALALQCLRLAVMAGFLILTAQAGAFALLAAAAGVFVGRWVVIRAAEQEAR